MKICVVGTGYVGLTTGTCLAAIGHEVVCTDSDAGKIADLNRGKMPIFEERLPELVAQGVAAGRLRFAADATAATREAEIIFICVGTPPDSEGRADMAAVEAVARQIAEHASGFKLVVGKSTVPVHTGERVKRVLTTYGRGQLEADVASNPEFLREGTGVFDFYHPDRIVAGCESERAAQLLHRIYLPVLEGRAHCGWHDRPLAECRAAAPEWLATSIASAELIKHASNSFLAMKISYANAIADYCELAGAQADEVLQGMGLDRRIGRDFLRPGIGFGGYCFPKDLSAFREMAGELGYDFGILREVEAINRQRTSRFVRRVRNALWVVNGKKIGVLGLAFKAGTDDTRLSPALAVVLELLRLGARIQAHDPAAMPRAERELGGAVRMCARPEEVADGAEAILLLTEWPEFRQLDWPALGARMARRLVMDGRNLLDRKAIEGLGFEYHGIGRPSAKPMAARLGSAGTRTRDRTADWLAEQAAQPAERS